jgi:DNA repair protein RadC
MRELGQTDRPREKLETSGVAALGDNELLAVLIGHGSSGVDALALANDVISTAGTVHGLTRLHRAQLNRLPGIGPVLTARILAAVELGRRTLVRPVSPRAQFLTAAQIAGYLLPKYGAHAEERFGVMTLDARLRLINTVLVSVGTLNASAAHPRAIFREATLLNAGAIVVFHNHPSGDPQPSSTDVALTQRLVDAGHVLDIPVVDHLILADNRYCSMRARKDVRWNE